jgi:effector-binding domain-containing protein
MMTKPKLEDRVEQPYVAIRSQTTMQQLGQAIEQGIDEVAGWMRQHAISPAGAPFTRYLVIDMARELEIEVGWPVASSVSGDGRIQAGAIPAGRYASLIYTGIDQGIPGNKALLDWGAAQGLIWDQWATDKGDGWGGRVEFSLTNPDEQLDRSKWETEVAIRLADQQPH